MNENSTCGGYGFSSNKAYYPRCNCDQCQERRRKCHDKMACTNTNTNTFNPTIKINVFPGQMARTIGVETVQYLAHAEDGKNVYTNNDALKQYGSSDILNPDDVSTINLFVNGVIQPPSLYDIEEGKLTLLSSDLPPIDAPIILLFAIVTG